MSSTHWGRGEARTTLGSTEVVAEPVAATGIKANFWSSRGHYAKFVLRSCAPWQGAWATLQAFALARHLHLTDWDGRVLIGLSEDVSQEAGIFVVGNQSSRRWSDVVDTAHVQSIVLPKMRQSCVVRAQCDPLFVGRTLASTAVDRSPWACPATLHQCGALCASVRCSLGCILLTFIGADRNSSAFAFRPNTVISLWIASLACDQEAVESWCVAPFASGTMQQQASALPTPWSTMFAQTAATPYRASCRRPASPSPTTCAATASSTAPARQECRLLRAACGRCAQCALGLVFDDAGGFPSPTPRGDCRGERQSAPRTSPRGLPRTSAWKSQAWTTRDGCFFVWGELAQMSHGDFDSQRHLTWTIRDRGKQQAHSQHTYKLWKHDLPVKANCVLQRCFLVWLSFDVASSDQAASSSCRTRRVLHEGAVGLCNKGLQ